METAKLNEVIIKETKRPDGTISVAFDYSNCPTLAEQHTAHLSDINYLMERYKPDELAAYISARNSHRMEINNHDFSQEPSLQEAKNVVVKLKQNFEELPYEIRGQFRNHVEFLKFIDNPANQDKMIKLGLMTKKEIAAVSTDAITKPPVAKKEIAAVSTDAITRPQNEAEPK